MKRLKKPIGFIAQIALGAIAMISLVLIILGGIFFKDPTSLINPKTINFTLKKTKLLKSWSWKKAEVNHQWIKWNHRRFSGSFEDLCLEYVRPEYSVASCMETISWNLDLTWNIKTGFNFLIKEPLKIDSQKTTVQLFETKVANETKAGPDYFAYWKTFWGKSIPDLDFHFHSIDLINTNKEIKNFNVSLVKQAKNLKLQFLQYEVDATPGLITITSPKQILLPYDLKTKSPVNLNELKLTADVLPNSLNLFLTGKLESFRLELHSRITREFLKQNPTGAKILKHLAEQIKGTLSIEKLVASIARLIRPPFNILPAPLNVLEGSLIMTLSSERLSDHPNSLLLKTQSAFNLAGASQSLVFNLACDFPFDFEKKEVGSMLIGLDLKKIYLRLPKLSKSKLPPQFRPDPRFKVLKNVAINLNTRPKKKKPKKQIDLKMKIEALGENALAIKTNLLDDILKLNFELEIENRTIKNGYVLANPIRTTLFKRPIYIPKLKIIFKAPLEPQIISTIEFHLPEYLVKLDLEGPLSKPRQAFSSVPPLPQDDIIAVLLFGRPLNSLDVDAKTATKDASQIISQGILSLAVLYYFAGSPVESIGYDPDTKVVSAQFGLGRRDSLHVSSGKGSGGLNAYGIRHSLGKGWYIDSTVQKSSEAIGTTSSNGGNNYGVLLERIISY